MNFSLLKHKKDSYLPAAIIIVFAIIYALISLVNHYLFRTAALDLGINTHAVYCYSRFMPSYYTLSYGGSEINFLGDHFSPIMFLYVPFYYLFGSYTLLLIQIAAILSGGYGIYKYSLIYFKDNTIPLLIMLHFFGIWGIFSALAFDFHNNVIAAMLVPWLFYFYKKEKYGIFMIFFLLIIFSKENMILWMVFLIAGIIFTKKERKFSRIIKFEIPLIIFSIIMFVLVMKVIMPYFTTEHVKGQLYRYSYLGGSLSEIIWTIIHKPLYILNLFYKNQLGNPFYDGIKNEFYLVLLFSGGLALLLRPAYLLMLIPIFAQKMLSSSYGNWGINGQYSIEIVPIISLALIDFLSGIKNLNVGKGIIVFVIISTFIVDYKVFEDRKSLWYDKVNTVFYEKEHYDTDLNIKAIYAKLKDIPDDVTISVGSALAPHLFRRKKIYLFPNVKDAEYIVLLYGNDKFTFPLKKDKFREKVSYYTTEGGFEKIYNQNKLMILKRLH